MAGKYKLIEFKGTLQKIQELYDTKRKGNHHPDEVSLQGGRARRGGGHAHEDACLPVSAPATASVASAKLPSALEKELELVKTKLELAQKMKAGEEVDELNRAEQGENTCGNA